MLNRYAWLALGVGAYIAFALSMFPAAAAYRWFAPDAVRLAGVEGTVWSGRAALASAGPLPLRDVRWTLDTLPLLTGRAAGRVQARLSDGFIDAAVTAAPSGRIELRDVQVSTSVAALASFAPIGGIRGQLSIQLDRAVLQDGWPLELIGDARIGRLEVPTFMPGGQGDPLPLGDYEVTIVESGAEVVRARFNDTSGPLDVSGTLSLDRAGRYAIDAMAAARAGAPRELVQALELMGGEPGPDGQRPFALSGSL